MLPYSLGHELVLWQRRNPLVTTSVFEFNEMEDSFKAEKLAEVALICCRKAPRLTSLWVKRTVRSITTPVAKRKGYDWVCGELNAEILHFRHYRTTGSLDLPCVAMPKTQGVPYHYFGAPELARLINYVAAHHSALITAHFEGSAFNFPYGLARILYTTAMECEGNVWVKNFQDEEREARVSALEEKQKRDGTTGFAIGYDAVRKMAEQWNSEHPDAPVPMPEEN